MKANGRSIRPVFVRDDAQIVAGLAGETYCGWLFVRYLWVSDGLRGRGVGRPLCAGVQNRANEIGGFLMAITGDFWAVGQAIRRSNYH
jgi:hypothetical protein